MDFSDVCKHFDLITSCTLNPDLDGDGDGDKGEIYVYSRPAQTSMNLFKLLLFLHLFQVDIRYSLLY